MNSNGIIVPSVTLESEMEILKDIAKKHEMNICELNSRDNAFGNLILVNDKGAIVSTELKKRSKKDTRCIKSRSIMHGLCRSVHRRVLGNC
jgi:translation initiation factor 6 (eIF-6)